MLRPFERDIVRRIRGRPGAGRGGKASPRKGIWIKNHLLECGQDYVYAMHLRWKGFIEEAGLNINAGTYQQFRTYIYVLKRLGLIERAGASSGGFSKSYYVLNPENVDSPKWNNPFKAYSRS